MIRGIFLAFFLTGCVEDKIYHIEEQSSIIAIIILFGSIAFLTLTPKIQKWNWTKHLMSFFIDRLSMSLLYLMIFLALLFLFGDPIGKLVAINLFISAAFLYRLKKDYHNKDDEIKVKDTRYFTITLPTIVALIFLYFHGLERVLDM